MEEQLGHQGTNHMQDTISAVETKKSTREKIGRKRVGTLNLRTCSPGQGRLDGREELPFHQCAQNTGLEEMPERRTGN